MNISTKLPSALSDSQEAIVPRKLFSELKLSQRKTVDLVQEGEGPDGTTNPFDHQNCKLWAMIISQEWSACIKLVNHVLNTFTNVRLDIVNQLSSAKGFFSLQAAKSIVEQMLLNIHNRFHEEKTAMKSECEYDYVWCVGLISFFLLCGYPPIHGDHEAQFYNSMNIGPVMDSEDWELMCKSHRFPSRGLKELSKESFEFIINVLDTSSYYCSSKDAYVLGWVDNRLRSLCSFDKVYGTTTQVSLDAYTSFCPSTVVARKPRKPVRKPVNKKPKEIVTADKNKQVNKKCGINIASFLTIMKIREQDFAKLAKNRLNRPEGGKTAAEWAAFWPAYSEKQSKKRKKPDYVCVSREKKIKKMKKKLHRDLNDLSKPCYYNRRMDKIEGLMRKRRYI